MKGKTTQDQEKQVEWGKSEIGKWLHHEKSRQGYAGDNHSGEIYRNGDVWIWDPVEKALKWLGNLGPGIIAAVAVVLGGVGGEAGGDDDGGGGGDPHACGAAGLCILVGGSPNG